MDLKAMISRLRSDWIEILRAPEKYGDIGSSLAFHGLASLLQDWEGITAPRYREGIATYLRGRVKGWRPTQLEQRIFLADDELVWVADVLEFLGVKLHGLEIKA